MRAEVLMSVKSAREKLDEARYFYRQLQRPDVQDDVNEVKYNLSALIGAARAARWHILNETEANPQLKSWWDRQETQKDPCVQYFDARRRIEIHEETAGLTRRTQIEVSASVELSGSLTLLVTRADGTTESYAAPVTAPLERPQTAIPTRQHAYVLTDYPGGGRDMIDACGELLRHLEAFVNGAEGHAR
jgi:hypothetical protein